jgi:hypothetical protein
VRRLVLSVNFAAGPGQRDAVLHPASSGSELAQVDDAGHGLGAGVVGVQVIAAVESRRQGSRPVRIP